MRQISYSKVVRLRRLVLPLLLLCFSCLLISTLFYRYQCPNPDDIHTNIPKDATIIITLERTECFVACPVYNLTIRDNGTIIYTGYEIEHNGQEFVEKNNIHTSKMSRQDFQKIIKAFEEYNYFALEAHNRRASNVLCGTEALENYATDGNNVITSITINNKRIEVNRYSGQRNAPEELKELENLIDELAQIEGWIK